MKKIIRENANIVVLFLLILLVPYGVIFTPKSDYEYYKDEKGSYNPNMDLKPSAELLPDFNGAGKTIGLGIQHDPIPFDDTYIQNDDGLVDDTMFSPGWGNSVLRDVADYGVVSYTGGFGSTDAGAWHFTTAYKDNDAKYLYLDSTWGNDYPGWIHMKWGAYSNIDAGSNTHVRQIRLNYEIWADSFAGVLDQSSNLRLYAYDDLDHAQYHTVAANPGHRVTYSGTFTLTSGEVFDRVRAGGYIKYLAVYMYSNEELWTHTWINVDYVDIWYDFYQPDIDFSYDLDFSGYGLTTVTEFELEFEITETVTGTNIYLYDYITSSWDSVLSLDTAGFYTKDITIEADHYFSGSKQLRVRFQRYNYYDGRLYTQYHIKVDYVKINIQPPDPPPNLHLIQDIIQVTLNWDAPNTYGAPITQYNIYRGTVEGGAKVLIDTTTLTEYNDTTGTIGLVYYYIVTAETVAGESENSTEVSGKSFDQPFVSWISPEEDETFIFPKSEPVTFYFSYDWGELDDVELIIEKGVFNVNHGSVWNETSIDIEEGSYLDGNVTCTLNGYNDSILVASDVREFTFVKIILEVGELLNSSTEILGKQLYLILHDPHGDNSHSHFSDTTKLSLGVGIERTSSLGVSLEVGYYADCFGIETGASLALSLKETIQTGFDFRWEITDTTSLTSSQVDDNADYIGPGYGDRYWGESWILKWVLNATYRVYSNGTDRYEDPNFFYGIIRDVDTFCSHEHAPEDWKSQNALYNTSLPVDWFGYEQKSGGAPYEYEHEVTSTFTRKKSMTIDLGAAFKTKFPGVVDSSISFDMSVKNYVESGVSSTHKVGYVLYDDDPTDFIVQGIGIDKTYGTYIFNSSSFICETSAPYEHNTFDYLPPEIGMPTIELDTDGDGLSPTTNDAPIVTVDIFEEDEVQEAILWYSINNGTDWNIAYLTELPGDLGTWEGTIPSQGFNLTVQWYVQAWDMEGNDVTRFDSYLNPFEYTVIALPESEKKVPGFPLSLILPIMTVSIIGLVTIRKHKYEK